jgi:GMP reductase
MKKKFDFNDITLIPQFSYVETRSDCDTSITFGKNRFRLPIVPANMESVIDVDLAVNLAKNQYFYILHRFDVDVVDFVRMMDDKRLISSISIGVNDDSYTIIDSLVNNNLTPDYITIDIAHGYSIKMERMVRYVKKNLPNSFLIGGNVCTPDAVTDLEEWGCDAVKCGIGGGSACTTYHSTGFGNRGWQASMIEDCAKVAKKPIIADGSIKNILILLRVLFLVRQW